MVEMRIHKVEGIKSFSRLDFPLPPHFVFGSSTSSYQVEGAAFEDGRTPSIWDTHAHSGYTNGANGDIGCDGYHKYKEDVHLMAETGLEAYRFSISWSRLIPNGTGAVNPKGLQFYNNLINELINHGMEPHVTLFHYDTPQILEDEYEGWLSKKAVTAFVAYADVCFREFGDRVLHWTTFNEPNVFAHYGYDFGILQPNRCSSPFGTNCTKGNSSTEPYIVAHNIILAHAATARLYSEKYKAVQHGFIGLDLYAYWYVPYTNSVEDVIATQRANDFFIGWFLNPLVYGDYPDIMKKNAGTRIPTFTKLESRLVKGSFDFLGVNHYSTIQVEDMSISLQMDVKDFTADMAVNLTLNDSNVPQGQLPLNPTGLRELLEYLKNYGNPPIYIYENGQSTIRNGTLHDIPRVQYIQSYIGSLLDAIRNGSNTRGYFIWSFLDVLELLDGYESGYGLYYVDLDDKNLKRYPKLSAKWYSDFLKGSSTSPDQEI
ncbi:beta-glucosidase 11-like [Heracleum sosnowskyi]|uniref:Beta-glucosidase 11-like n=1 Tax=Heracleum sosnowskyi TaxID=360622 RepID=A0AAD8N1Z6_9APIA|nr:beta-glucosidase 11-like [Heracleum sosnowskyi]